VLRLDVILENAATPHRVINLVLGRTNRINPDLEHWRVALIEQRPLTRAQVVAAGAGGGCRPDVVAVDANAVDDVIAEAGIELREGVNAPCGDAIESAHRSRPHVAGVLVECERKDSLVGHAIRRAIDLPFTVFVNSKAIVGSSPDAPAIDQHAVHVIVGQAIRGREVLPAKHRYVRRCSHGGERQSGYSSEAKNRSSHNVLKYSIRSFSSSFVRSLVTPC